MLKKLIKKLVNEAMAEKSGKPDQSAELKALQDENTRLKEQLANSGATKRLETLKTLVAGIPDNAQGMGSIAVLEDGAIKNVSLKSKKDLTDLVARAEKGEIEVLLS